MRLDTKLLKQLNNQKQKPISITPEILQVYQNDFALKTTGIKSDSSRWNYLKKVLSITKYQINHTVINQTINELGINNNTKNTIVAYFVSLYKWLNVKFNLDLKPQDLVRYEKQAVNKQALTRTELENIATILKAYGNKKYELIFHLLMTNGMRVSELASIDFNNIQGDFVFIKSQKQKGGGRQTRLAYLNPYVKQLISQAKDLNLNANLVQQMFKNMKEHFNVVYPEFKKPFSPHILRYTFATLMYENNIPLPVVSKLMGHANVEMTMNTYVRDNPAVQLKYFKMFELNPIEVLDVQLLTHENFLLKKMLVDYGISPNHINLHLTKAIVED